MTTAQRPAGHWWAGEGAPLRRLMSTPPPVATSHAYALIGAMFYASGGAVLLLVGQFAGRAGHRTTLDVIGVGALLLGLVVARRAAYFPLALRVTMNFLGTSLVLSAVILAGPGDGGRAAFWLFCYVPVDSFVFFAWRWAFVQFAWGLAATGIAALQVHVIDRLEWAAVLVVAGAMAAVIAWLVRFGTEVLQDSLTGVANRRGLDERLAAHCADGHAAGHLFSLAAVRISGPGLGEEQLLALAQRWQREAPRQATWARLSTEDFAVLWDGPEGVDEYLPKVVATAGPARRVAVGVCDFQRGYDPSHMLNEANTGRIFSSRGSGSRITRSGLVTARVEELHEAISSGDVRPFYQPVVDMLSREVIGAEALARWCHPQRGIIGPGEFIPLAEQSGVVRELGAAILRQACQDAATWRDLAGRPMKVAVNVSGEQLRDEGFIDLVARCLTETGLPAESLTLEVTESTVGGDDPRARDILAELRLMRISVAMDDFGTGYSNLSRLAALPIDVLKIDQSFVRPLGRNHRAATIVEAPDRHGFPARARHGRRGDRVRAADVDPADGRRRPGSGLPVRPGLPGERVPDGRPQGAAGRAVRPAATDAGPAPGRVGVIARCRARRFRATPSRAGDRDPLRSDR